MNGSVDVAGVQGVLLIWVLKEPWAWNEIGELHFLTADSPPPPADRCGLSSPFKSIALGRVTGTWKSSGRFSNSVTRTSLEAV